MRNDTLAVILGGGQGKRLFPLTLHRSKPAVPLAGKYRLIDVTISNCINSGLRRIFILTQFNSASLNRHVSRTYRFSQFSQGFVEILAAEQTPHNPDWFQGTADAVRQVMHHFEELNPRHVLILSGDHLYRMDYRLMLRHHEETKADVTVSVIPVAEEQASSFGLLKTGEGGRIVEFSEKPPPERLAPMRVDTSRFGLDKDEAAARPFLASMGVYAFKYDILRQLLKEESQVDFGHQVIPAAISSVRVQAYLFKGYWEDIGTIRSFYQANLDLTSPVPKFSILDPEAPIYTRARFLPASKLGDCRVRQSIISDGSIINSAEITRSIIGIRSRVERGARLEEVLALGADYYQTIEELEEERRKGIPWIGIGENTIIRHAIIDKNARIGANVRILNEAGVEHFDGDEYYIREGIVIVPKGATIADGTVI